MNALFKIVILIAMFPISAASAAPLAFDLQQVDPSVFKVSAAKTLAPHWIEEMLVDGTGATYFPTYNPKGLDLIKKSADGETEWATLLDFGAWVGNGVAKELRYVPQTNSIYAMIDGGILQSSATLPGAIGLFSIDATTGKLNWVYKARSTLNDELGSTSAFAVDSEGSAYFFANETGPEHWVHLSRLVKVDASGRIVFDQIVDRATADATRCPWISAMSVDEARKLVTIIGSWTNATDVNGAFVAQQIVWRHHSTDGRQSARTLYDGPESAAELEKIGEDGSFVAFVEQDSDVETVYNYLAVDRDGRVTKSVPRFYEFGAGNATFGNRRLFVTGERAHDHWMEFGGGLLLRRFDADTLSLIGEARLKLKDVYFGGENPPFELGPQDVFYVGTAHELNGQAGVPPYSMVLMSIDPSSQAARYAKVYPVTSEFEVSKAIKTGPKTFRVFFFDDSMRYVDVTAP